MLTADPSISLESLSQAASTDYANYVLWLKLQEAERRIHRQVILAQFRANKKSETNCTTTSPPVSPSHLQRRFLGQRKWNPRGWPSSFQKDSDKVTLFWWACFRGGHVLKEGTAIWCGYRSWLIEMILLFYIADVAKGKGLKGTIATRYILCWSTYHDSCHEIIVTSRWHPRLVSDFLIWESILVDSTYSSWDSGHNAAVSAEIVSWIMEA